MSNENPEKSVPLPLPLSKTEPWNSAHWSIQGRENARNFIAQPTDVIFPTFPKTGSTLVTWIGQLIRMSVAQSPATDLPLDLNSFVIDQAVMFMNDSYDLDIDLNCDQEYFPRLFKSHETLSASPSGCKYIVTIRDCLKTALSGFYFRKTVYNTFLNQTLSDYVQNDRLLNGKAEENRQSIWTHYSEFWKVRNHPSVLVIPYEDLIGDMENCIKLMADHMGIKSLNQNMLNRIMESSTKGVMKEPEERSNKWVLQRKLEIGRFTPKHNLTTMARVATSRPISGETDPEIINFMKNKWIQELKPVTGMANYDEFCEAFRRLNKEKLAKLR
mmetsp:Transcript_2059/g.2988  ORF Transcript_2059/g.2988 Transcript_2059/m.2988 type:complete len:329 (-) Transcript_2059:30-1016(-)